MKRKDIISIILLSTFICLSGCTNQKKTPSESVEESIVSEEPSIVESQSESEEESEERITEGTIKKRLQALPRVKNVKPNGGSNFFLNTYIFDFEQYIDHNDKSKGTFYQSVEIGFNGFDLPNVFVTSGYMTSMNNASYQQNENELAFLLECNYIFVEHRYFDTSLPVELDYSNVETWKYLTTEQSARDHHDIVTQMKRILDGKWVSTGMSKGGMTTELYAYYHPGDMDLYLPYVAPFCNSIADTRMMKFIFEEAGDKQYGETRAKKYRDEVLEFQTTLLSYRNVLAPKFYQDGIKAGCQFSELTTADNLFDAAVIEFGIGFWQYNQDYKKLENTLKTVKSTTETLTNKQNACYSMLTSVSSPSDLAVNNEFTPYYVQAYQELGNYGYDFSYIRNALTDKALLTVKEDEERDLMFNLALTNEERKLEKKPLMYTKINEMLKTSEENFIIIYGSSDPWYAVRPDDVERDNVSIYVSETTPHGTFIGSSFGTTIKNEILTKIKTILGMEA